MKKYFLKSFALLAMLFSAITMNAATKYCGEQVQSTIDNTTVSIGVTILKVDNALRVSFESENISGIRAGGTFQQWGNGVWANQDDAVANFKDGWTQNGTIWTKDFAFSTYPSSGQVDIHCLFDIINAGSPTSAGFTLTDIDIFATCDETPGSGEGGEDSEPTPGYSAGAGADYTYLYTNDNAGNVYLWLTYNEAIAGAEDPHFYTNDNQRVNATTTDNKVFFASVSGKKDGDKVQLRAYIPRAGGLTQTSLLSHTVGTESGLIVTEYCNYTNNQLTKNGASITLSWETVDNGDVVITMGNGVGTTSCSYRNGGFEGGIEAFVVSTDNFATTTPASDYFTFEKVYSGNESRLVNIANLPKGAKIKHIGAGHALAWVVNGTNEYDFPDFIYTYGGVCNNLDAPTNVAVTDAGVLTFEGVEGADTYEVHVYLGDVLKHTQDIVSGGTINFSAYVAGTYTVKVIAKGAGKGDSDESDPATWNMTASPLPGSNYCETPADRITANQGPCNPLFTWITDASGNVVITVSASEGNEGETMFRNNGMNGAFSLDGSVDNFNAYFNKGKTDDYTYTLTLKDAANKPALGSVISFSGQIEAKSSINTDDWSNYEFDGYLYGTKCDGPKRVTVSVNDAAMGTAKVNGQDEVYVDSDTEVTFTATPNEGYVFANWTKGDEVVSTSATYTTTITSALSLVANFDYIRTIYCQTPVLTNAGHIVYLTVGQAATPGKYQIKIEGTSDMKITGINNANTAMNCIKFTGIDIEYDQVNDVPLTIANGGWEFSENGNGVITSIEFEPSTGKTWKDMWMWRPDLYFKTSLSNEEQINDVLAQQNHFDWSNKCEEDTDKPVMGTAEPVSQSHNTATIAVTATDNRMVHSYHVVSTTPAHDQTIEPVDGNITVTGLTANTDYTFTITAIDLAGLESENNATVSVKTNAYIAEPSSLPTAPTWPANQVKAVYSATYDTDCGFGNWSGDVQYTPEEYGKKYVNATAGYFGLVDFELNCSKMECLHIDVWAAESFSMGIVPIHGAAEVRVTKNIIGGQWNYIEIPLTEFAGVPNWNNVYQIKIDQVPNQTFWLNNIYFYTTQAPTDVTPPTNITATATPAFETAVISCSAIDDSEIFFEVKLPRADGTYESKGTGKANSGKIANIVVANLQENREFKMFVFAKDEYGNEAEDPVEVTFTTNEYPEPAPTPMWAPENVKSIYSDSYTPAWASLNSYNEGWYLPPQILEATLTANNHALNYFNLIQDGVIGWQFAPFDATDYTTFTMDIYPINDGTIDFGPITESVPEYVVTNISVKGKQWNTITIDLRGKDLTKIYQVKMANYQGLGTFLIDNVYFYKMVIDENTDLTKLANGLECDVILKRNFVMDNDWNTISLPFALTEEQVKEVFGEGTRITKLLSSELKSSTEIDIQFEDVTSIEAATPYLILPKKNVDLGTLIENITINVTPNILEAGITKMIPVLKTENFTGQDNTFFLGANDNLYNRSADGKIKGMRAYFQFSTLTPEQLRNVRARVVFNENTETNVDNITIDEAPIKVIQNGQLIIIRNGVKYNVQGQKL